MFKSRIQEAIIFSGCGTLDVSLKGFPQAEYNKRKVAYKRHVEREHDGLMPAFVALTPSKTDAQTQAKRLAFPERSVLTLDQGYSDDTWHNPLTG